MGVDRVFLDTCLIVAASVKEHPGHVAAVGYLEALKAERALICISPQVCREFMVTLTRSSIGPRTFSVGEALQTFATWRSSCALLEEDDSTVLEWQRLVERYQVRGKQVHDCNIVAVMLANGVSRLGTQNAADFARFDDEISVEPVLS